MKLILCRCYAKFMQKMQAQYAQKYVQYAQYAKNMQNKHLICQTCKKYAKKICKKQSKICIICKNICNTKAASTEPPTGRQDTNHIKIIVLCGAGISRPEIRAGSALAAVAGRPDRPG